jgi:hypothetical protein
LLPISGIVPIDNYLSGNRIGAMTTQTTLDLVTKLPLSEAPRKGKYFNQKALQVSGEVTSCDPHPRYEGLFYWCNQTDGTQRWHTEEYWKNKGLLTPTEIHEKRRAAREHNLTKPDSEPRVYEDGNNVGCIDQQAVQVSWKPKEGDVHPKYPNYRYYCKQKISGQVWMTLETFNKRIKQQRSQKKTPKGRETQRKAHKKRLENGKCSGVHVDMYKRSHAEYEEGLITLEDRDKVWKLTDLRIELNVGLEYKEKWNLDHIIPETHGGLTTVQNLQMVPYSWHGSKLNRNRHVMAHYGSDCDIWYRTPYVMPKTREWTHSLADKEITTLSYQRPPSCSCSRRP